MLYAGSDDGVYRIPGFGDGREAPSEHVLRAEQVYRLRQFDDFDGLFATAETGLYHTLDGVEWTAVPHPRDQVYAVAAGPSDGRLYTGTRPAEVYVAESTKGAPTDPDAWTELRGLRQLGAELDWGLERHDNLAQVRSLQTHPTASDRLVAGVEVGGVHVSDDRGETWASRRIEGFDAPHTDDIHHLAMPDAETLVASTGSGLYRSTDVGRSWSRLDTGYRQRYFREALEYAGRLYAGAAPASSTSWESDPDHALFEADAGETLERVESPVPDEHPIGWEVVDGAPVVGTHRGTLLRRGGDGWERVGSAPTPGSVRGRYLPLAWFDP